MKDQRNLPALCLLLAMCGFACVTRAALADVEKVDSDGPARAAPAAERSKRGFAGFVLEARGDWRVIVNKQEKRLKNGDAIPDGASLRLAGTSGSIDAVLIDGTRFHCPGSKLCGSPLAVAKAPTILESWLAAIADVFSSRHEVWVSPISRGLENATREAVVERRGGLIDLTPAIKDLSGGTYEVTIYGVTHEGGRDSTRKMVSDKVVMSDRKGSLTIPGDFADGVYYLTTAQPGREVQDAVICVCGSETFAAEQASFQRAVEESTKLTEGLSDWARRSMLRAYLISCHGVR